MIAQPFCAFLLVSIYNEIMKLNVPDHVLELMNLLKKNNKECYIVGGAVRSALLELPIHDYDLTTNALPEEMKEIFQDFPTIETGLKHGTLIVINKHKPIEITTYRKDSEYKDHRHPEAVIFSSSLEEDCARRDFTVNALCWNEEEGLKDFFDGQTDLKNRVIRCIRNPEERFEEDALRILRAIRFSCQLHFEIEEETSKALKKKRELLQYISVERIHEELNGILSSKICADKIDAYRDVFEVFLPELYDYSNEEYEKMLLSLDRCVNVADIRMALLLTPSKDPHRILNRLKYSTKSMKSIQSLVQYRMNACEDSFSLRKLLNQLPCDFEEYLYYRSALEENFPKKDVQLLYQKIQKDDYCWDLKHLQINGQDLIELGYQGKEIKEALEKTLNDVIEEKLPNQRELLLKSINRVGGIE